MTHHTEAAITSPGAVVPPSPATPAPQLDRPTFRNPPDRALMPCPINRGTP